MCTPTPYPGSKPRSRTIRGWEHFPHVADVGIRAWGGSREAAFEEAGRALTAVVTEVTRVAPRQPVEIACAAPDDEALLVEWLNAIVYEMATRRMLFADYHIHIADGRLTGSATGEPIDVARHEPAAEIKGATYTELKVAHRDDGTWLAQCVVDV